MMNTIQRNARRATLHTKADGGYLTQTATFRHYAFAVAFLIALVHMVL